MGTFLFTYTMVYRSGYITLVNALFFTTVSIFIAILVVFCSVLPINHIIVWGTDSRHCVCLFFLLSCNPQGSSAESIIISQYLNLIFYRDRKLRFICMFLIFALLKLYSMDFFAMLSIHCLILFLPADHCTIDIFNLLYIYKVRYLQLLCSEALYIKHHKYDQYNWYKIIKENNIVYNLKKNKNNNIML